MASSLWSLLWTSTAFAGRRLCDALGVFVGSQGLFVRALEGHEQKACVCLTRRERLAFLRCFVVKTLAKVSSLSPKTLATSQIRARFSTVFKMMGLDRFLCLIAFALAIHCMDSLLF